MNFNTDNDFYVKELSFLSSLSFISWEDIENKTVLITGANGLIGSYLIDLLMFRNKYHNSNIMIYGISRNEDKAKIRFKKYFGDPLFYFIKQDISEKIILKADVDFIIHAASNAFPASFSSNPVETMKGNFLGMSNLLDFALLTNNKKVLYVSSGEIYGEGNGNDFSEEYNGYIDLLNSRSCYPQSKRAAETLCVCYAEEYKLNTIIVRPSHVYGATFTEFDNRAYAQFFRNVLNKRDVILKSKGLQFRSYCYIADCISALLVVLLNGHIAQAYNISNPNSSVTLYELAQKIAAAGGQQVIMNIPGIEGKREHSGISRAVLSSSKLEMLGWRPNYSLDEGVRNVYNILTSF